MARRSFELNGSKAEDFGLETEPTSAKCRNQMKLQLSLAASWGFIQIERPLTIQNAQFVPPPVRLWRRRFGETARCIREQCSVLLSLEEGERMNRRAAFVLDISLER